MLMGAGASWYGGFTHSVSWQEDDGPQVLCAFDDGDIRKYTGKILEQYLTLKTIEVADEAEGGIIDNVKGLWMAEKILFGKRQRGQMMAVGVLVGQTHELLGGAPIYMEHRACSEIAKKSFIRPEAAVEESLRNGFQTLRRGDRVSYCAASKSARSEAVPCAVVYGLLIYEHPEHAQRKVVILYEETSATFSLGFWAQWTRILRRNIAAGSLDGSLDKDESVQSVAAEECDEMLKHYKSSLTFVNLQGGDGVEEILRLAALPRTTSNIRMRKADSPMVPSANNRHDEPDEAPGMERAGRGGRGAGGRSTKRGEKPPPGGPASKALAPTGEKPPPGGPALKALAPTGEKPPPGGPASKVLAPAAWKPPTPADEKAAEIAAESAAWAVAETAAATAAEKVAMFAAEKAATAVAEIAAEKAAEKAATKAAMAVAEKAAEIAAEKAAAPAAAAAAEKAAAAGKREIAMQAAVSVQDAILKLQQAFAGTKEELQEEMQEQIQALKGAVAKATASSAHQPQVQQQVQPQAQQQLQPQAQQQLQPQAQPQAQQQFQPQFQPQAQQQFQPQFQPQFQQQAQQQAQQQFQPQFQPQAQQQFQPQFQQHFQPQAQQQFQPQAQQHFQPQPQHFGAPSPERWSDIQEQDRVAYLQGALIETKDEQQRCQIQGELSRLLFSQHRRKQTKRRW